MEKTKRQQALGNQGPLIGRFGYGAMVLEGYYGASDDEQAVQSLIHAMKAGMMIDSADAYGNGHNEKLIAKALKALKSQSNEEKPFIASKFGIVFDEGVTSTPVSTGWGFSLPINGTPEYTKKAIDSTLQRLEVDTLDLWYLHYPDPSVPIEETMGAMSQAVKEGKVKYLGLSNVSADQVKKAHTIHPVQAVQYEYSLWRREAELELIPTLRELGIPLVAWSPLGGGFLSGEITMGENDFRNNNPRYQGTNLQKNQDRFAPLKELSDSLGITPAALALAWLAHQGKDIFAIPGTRKISRIDENNGYLDIELSKEILRQIDGLAPVGSAVGATLL